MRYKMSHLKKKTMSKLLYHEPNYHRSSAILLKLATDTRNQIILPQELLTALTAQQGNVFWGLFLVNNEYVNMPIIDGQMCLTNFLNLCGLTANERMPVKGTSFFLKTFWVKFVFKNWRFFTNNIVGQNVIQHKLWLEYWIVKKKNNSYAKDYSEHIEEGDFVNRGPMGYNTNLATDEVPIPECYTNAKMRACVNDFQLLYDRCSEVPRRNPQSYRIWAVVKRGKITFSKPKAYEFTPNPDLGGTYVDSDFKTRNAFCRLKGMRTIRTDKYGPNTSDETGLRARSENESVQVVPSRINDDASLAYGIDPNYEYWLYFRWQIPLLTSQPPTMAPLSSWIRGYLQVGSTWWED
jgi:hypothetical protein